MRTHKGVAAALLSVVATGAVIAGSGPVAGFTLGTVVATPNSNLVNNQQVAVAISNFGNGTQVFAAECDPRVISTQDSSYCDTSSGHVVGPITADSSGSANFPFTVHTGKSFAATNPSAVCDGQHACDLVVADSLSAPNHVGFTQLTFKDTRAATTTTLRSKTSVKAGAKVRFVAVTKHRKNVGKLTGKVVFTDNGKKFARKSEKATGKVVVRHKLTKGRHHIVARYSGNKHYKPSKAKRVVVAKR